MPLYPTDDSLHPDQRLLVETVSTFAREELLPRDRRWDLDETSVAEVLPRLSEMGLLALALPESMNGLECDFRTYASIIHELAVWSPSTAVTISVHNMVVSLIFKRAQEPKRTEWLSGLSEAAHFAAFAASEAGAGSDIAGVRTTCEPVSGGYCLNGEKMWITNGMAARWFLTLARLPGVPDEQSYCAFLVDGETPGIERTKIRGKMGIRGSETAVIAYRDVHVPHDQMLGEHGDGRKVFLSSLAEGRISIAAQSCGIGEACLAEMTAYARQREQFGQPIGKFQAIASMIADSAMELDAARVLIWQAASDVDAGRLNRSSSSMAKLFASEAANRIANRAVQVHGGTGYVQECRAEQLYRDARVTTIYEGTSEVQRMVIARALLQ